MSDLETILLHNIYSTVLGRGLVINLRLRAGQDRAAGHFPAQDHHRRTR